VRDLFEQQPTQNFQQLVAEDLLVTRVLTVEDEVLFTKNASFKDVGRPGNAAFTNSWVNFGGGWANAGYWRDPFGWVRLRGRVKDGSAALSMFTLPPGFRPQVPVLSVNAASLAGGYIQVLADGTVTPSIGGGGAWISLDNVHFKAL
jgi:hypothetical protein